MFDNELKSRVPTNLEHYTPTPRHRILHTPCGLLFPFCVVHEMSASQNFYHSIQRYCVVCYCFQMVRIPRNSLVISLCQLYNIASSDMFLSHLYVGKYTRFCVLLDYSSRCKHVVLLYPFAFTNLMTFPILQYVSNRQTNIFVQTAKC